MRKTPPRLKYALVIVAVLLCSGAFVSALALSAEEETENVASSTIQVNGQTAVLTASTAHIADNETIKEHGFLLSPLEDHSSAMNEEVPYISQQDALSRALERVQVMTQDGADAVNIALVTFSDTETPFLPEANLSLTNVPVWLVSFENIMVPRGNQGKTDPVQAHVNVVVDAQSGQILEVFSYSAG